MTSRLRTSLFLTVAVALTVALALFLMVRGAATMDLERVLAALRSGFGLGGEAPPTDVAIVFDVRLPRVLVAVFAGASLALAGTVMQAVFRNPLASPDVMGTQAGAALGAVLVIAFGWASVSVFAAPTAAFLGAALVSVIVFLAATGPGGGTTVTGVLLAGMALNALVGAATAFVVSAFHRGSYSRSDEILQWLMGGLDKSTMQAAWIVMAGFAACALLVAPLARDLDVMTLRESSAASLGLDVPRLRKVLLAIACAVTATAVSSTGGIAFVGLVVPHMARLVVGPAHRALLPCAACAGAFTLLLADAIVLMFGAELNLRTGVVTAGLGAPFFLYLLARYRRGYAL